MPMLVERMRSTETIRRWFCANSDRIVASRSMTADELATNL
jgi:hypothetical protein